MKLSTQHDIDAPLDHVFSMVSDFEAFERQMLRRGIDVRRDERLPLDQPGARWEADVSWRGRQMTISTELKDMVRNEAYSGISTSGGLNCQFDVAVVRLSNTRTRLYVTLDFRPTTLSSRLMVQSLKLGKRNLERRFTARVADFARSIEAAAGTPAK